MSIDADTPAGDVRLDEMRNRDDNESSLSRLGHA